MPKVRSLTGEEAKQTFVARKFPGVVDKLRQIATNLGVRPYRVFLVWTRYSGSERGEGDEREVTRVEILPTPRVVSLDALALTSFSAGVLPVGSVKVDRISAQLTYDELTGRTCPHGGHIPEPSDFFYEIVEDGRGDPNPPRLKFRLLSPPVRQAGKVQWAVTLERVSEDRDTHGRSQVGTDVES